MAINRIVLPLFFILLIFLYISDSPAGTVSHNSILVLLDSSGSMKKSDPKCLRSDAVRLLVDLLPDGDRVLISEFGDSVRTSSNDFLILDSESRLMADSSMPCSANDRNTDLLAALEFALKRINSIPKDIRESYPPTVFILTDGKDDVPEGSDRAPILAQTLKIFASLNIPIYAVGLSRNVDQNLLRQLAETTGGEVYSVESANDLYSGFASLSRVISKRWNLGDFDTNGGSFSFEVPHWVDRVCLTYIPGDDRSQRFTLVSGESIHAILKAKYSTTILNTSKIKKIRVDVPQPGGRLIADAEAELLLQAMVPRMLPLNYPVLFQARLLAPNSEELGSPKFLQSMTAFFSWKTPSGTSSVVPLYDDGKHEDGKAGDGFFGGYSVLPFSGLCGFEVAARGILSSRLTTRGEVEVVAPPAALTVPLTLFDRLKCALSGKVNGVLSNQTDIPLELEYSTSGPQSAGTRIPISLPAKSLQVIQLESKPSTFDGKDEIITVYYKGLPQAFVSADVHLYPNSVIWGPPLALVFLFLLTCLLPRRSASQSLLVITGKHQGSSFDSTIRIDRDGDLMVGHIPAPFGIPGSFTATSGVWTRGIVFRPSKGMNPQFIGNKPTMKRRGFLIKRTVTWEYRTHEGEARYTFTPKI